MLSWFKKKEPVSHVFEPPVTSSLFKPAVSGFRTGMWVVHKETVGILHKFVDALTVEFHNISLETGETGTQINSKIIQPAGGVFFGGTGNMTSNTSPVGPGNPGERTKVGTGV